MNELSLLKKALDYEGSTGEIKTRLKYLINTSSQDLNRGLTRICKYRRNHEEILSHPSLELFMEIANLAGLPYESREPVLEIFARHYLKGHYREGLDAALVEVNEKLRLERQDIARILLS